jgi:hypothetical protein
MKGSRPIERDGTFFGEWRDGLGRFHPAQRENSFSSEPVFAWQSF